MSNKKKPKQTIDQMHIPRMQLNYIYFCAFTEREREINPNGKDVLDVLQYDARIKCRYYKLECENASPLHHQNEANVVRRNVDLNQK